MEISCEVMSKDSNGAGTSSRFIGFSAFDVKSPKMAVDRGDKGLRSPDRLNEVLYQGDDADLRVIMKKLRKKDVGTRLRALAELKELIRVRDRSVLKDFLGSWCTCFVEQLALHNERRVRIGALDVFTELTKAGLRKSFLEYFSVVLPFWVLLLSDPTREVSTTAQVSLMSLFETESQLLRALSHHWDEILKELTGLCTGNFDDLSDMRFTSEEEAMERKKRVNISAFSCITMLVKKVHDFSTSTSGSAVIDGKNGENALDSKSTNLVVKFYTALMPTLQSPKFWSIGPNVTPANRQAMYLLLVTVLRLCPKLLIAEEKVCIANETDQERVRVYHPHKATINVLCSACDEKDSQAITSAVQLIEEFPIQFPGIWGGGDKLQFEQSYCSKLKESSSRFADWKQYQSLFKSSRKKRDNDRNVQNTGDNGGSNSEEVISLAKLPPFAPVYDTILSKILRLLRRGGYGAPESIYGILPSFLKSLPRFCLFACSEKDKAKLNQSRTQRSEVKKFNALEPFVFSLHESLLSALIPKAPEHVLPASSLGTLYNTMITVATFVLSELDTKTNTSLSLAEEMSSDMYRSYWSENVCALSYSFFSILVHWGLLKDSELLSDPVAGSSNFGTQESIETEEDPGGRGSAEQATHTDLVVRYASKNCSTFPSLFSLLRKYPFPNSQRRKEEITTLLFHFLNRNIMETVEQSSVVTFLFETILSVVLGFYPPSPTDPSQRIVAQSKLDWDRICNVSKGLFPTMQNYARNNNQGVQPLLILDFFRDTIMSIARYLFTDLKLILFPEALHSERTLEAAKLSKMLQLLSEQPSSFLTHIAKLGSPDNSSTDTSSSLDSLTLSCFQKFSTIPPVDCAKYLVPFLTYLTKIFYKVFHDIGSEGYNNRTLLDFIYISIPPTVNFQFYPISASYILGIAEAIEIWNAFSKSKSEGQAQMPLSNAGGDAYLSRIVAHSITSAIAHSEPAYEKLLLALCNADYHFTYGEMSPFMSQVEKLTINVSNRTFIQTGIVDVGSTFTELLNNVANPSIDLLCQLYSSSPKVIGRFVKKLKHLLPIVWFLGRIYFPFNRLSTILFKELNVFVDFNSDIDQLLSQKVSLGRTEVKMEDLFMSDERIMESVFKIGALLISRLNSQKSFHRNEISTDVHLLMYFLSSMISATEGTTKAISKEQVFHAWDKFGLRENSTLQLWIFASILDRNSDMDNTPQTAMSSETFWDYISTSNATYPLRIHANASSHPEATKVTSTLFYPCILLADLLSELETHSLATESEVRDRKEAASQFHTLIVESFPVISDVVDPLRDSTGKKSTLLPLHSVLSLIKLILLLVHNGLEDVREEPTLCMVALHPIYTYLCTHSTGMIPKLAVRLLFSAMIRAPSPSLSEVLNACIVRGIPKSMDSTLASPKKSPRASELKAFQHVPVLTTFPIDYLKTTLPIASGVLSELLSIAICGSLTKKLREQISEFSATILNKSSLDNAAGSIEIQECSWELSIEQGKSVPTTLRLVPLVDLKIVANEVSPYLHCVSFLLKNTETSGAEIVPIVKHLWSAVELWSRKLFAIRGGCEVDNYDATPQLLRNSQREGANIRPTFDINSVHSSIFTLLTPLLMISIQLNSRHRPEKELFGSSSPIDPKFRTLYTVLPFSRHTVWCLVWTYLREVLVSVQSHPSQDFLLTHLPFFQLLPVLPVMDIVVEETISAIKTKEYERQKLLLWKKKKITNRKEYLLNRGSLVDAQDAQSGDENNNENEASSCGNSNEDDGESVDSITSEEARQHDLEDFNAGLYVLDCISSLPPPPHASVFAVFLAKMLTFSVSNSLSDTFGTTESYSPSFLATLPLGSALLSTLVQLHHRFSELSNQFQRKKAQEPITTLDIQEVPYTHPMLHPTLTNLYDVLLCAITQTNSEHDGYAEVAPQLTQMHSWSLPVSSILMRLSTIITHVPIPETKGHDIKFSQKPFEFSQVFPEMILDALAWSHTFLHAFILSENERLEQIKTEWKTVNEEANLVFSCEYSIDEQGESIASNGSDGETDSETEGVSSLPSAFMNVLSGGKKLLSRILTSGSEAVIEEQDDEDASTVFSYLDYDGFDEFKIDPAYPPGLLLYASPQLVDDSLDFPFKQLLDSLNDLSTIIDEGLVNDQESSEHEEPGLETSDEEDLEKEVLETAVSPRNSEKDMIFRLIPLQLLRNILSPHLILAFEVLVEHIVNEDSPSDVPKCPDLLLQSSLVLLRSFLITMTLIQQLPTQQRVMCLSFLRNYRGERSARSPLPDDNSRGDQDFVSSPETLATNSLQLQVPSLPMPPLPRIVECITHLLVHYHAKSPGANTAAASHTSELPLPPCLPAGIPPSVLSFESPPSNLIPDLSHIISYHLLPPSFALFLAVAEMNSQALPNQSNSSFVPQELVALYSQCISPLLLQQMLAFVKASAVARSVPSGNRESSYSIYFIDQDPTSSATPLSNALFALSDLCGTMNTSFLLPNFSQYGIEGTLRSPSSIEQSSDMYWSSRTIRDVSVAPGNYIFESVEHSYLVGLPPLVVGRLFPIPPELTYTYSSNERLVNVNYAGGEGEVNLSFSVQFPPMFPVSKPVIKCSRKVGLSDTQWARIELGLMSVFTMGGQSGTFLLHDRTSKSPLQVQGLADDAVNQKAEDEVLFDEEIQVVTLSSNSRGPPVNVVSPLSMSLVHAFRLFGQAIQRELQGLEPCPICYSMLAHGNKALPRMKCSTCVNKFHSECLRKWFSNSKDHTCPMCRQKFRK